MTAPSTKAANETTTPRLFTRADTLAILKIGETTLFWLQRTGKLQPIRIGSRVLFSAAEIERIAMRGATLTAAEKEDAAKREREAIPPRGRGRPRKNDTATQATSPHGHGRLGKVSEAKA
jgi:hypothetical protein